MFGFNIKHNKATFNYIPRFYEENENDLKHKLKAARMEAQSASNSKPGTSIRGAFTSQKNKKSKKQANLRNQNIRLVVILLILTFLIWQISTSEFIQHLLDRFEPNTYDSYE